MVIGWGKLFNNDGIVKRNSAAAGLRAEVPNRVFSSLGPPRPATGSAAFKPHKAAGGF